jgi:DegV family protein with EDD domain
MLRIFTDGAADMPEQWKSEYDIQVVPVNIHFGEQTYLQGVDLDHEGFYRLVDTTGKIPKTSQPTPHQFIEAYRAGAQPGDTILSIHVTSKLSGTYESSVAASRELEGEFHVVPFDSACGSMGIGMMCREARIMEQHGASIEEIVKRLEEVRTAVQVVLSLNTLEYAQKSGRVGTLQAALASVLNVKPIAALKDGVLEMRERVRTRRASIDRMVEMLYEQFGDTPLVMGVVHARDEEAGKQLRDQVHQRFRATELFFSDLSISLAANLGPGTVGIIAYPAQQK